MKPNNKQKKGLGATLSIIGVVVIIAGISLVACLNNNGDNPTPPNPPITETRTIEQLNDTLEHKLLNEYKLFKETENANWDNFKILCVYNANGKSVIESCVPVDDTDYEYCTFTSSFNECETFADLVDNYTTAESSLSSSLVDSSYYTLSDDIIQLLLENVKDNTFETSKFFESNGIESYFVKTEANYMTIYNTSCNQKVTINFSKPLDNPPYVSIDAIKDRIATITYSDYTEEDLKNDNFLFTYKDLEKKKEKEIQR